MDQLFTSLLTQGPFEFCSVPETQGDLCANIGIGKDWYVNNRCGNAWVPSYRATSLPRGRGGTRMSRGYQARPKNHVIRVVFQDQAMYAYTSFRGEKTCKIGKNCVFLVI